MAAKPMLMSVLLMAAFGVSAGQIYKWVDAEGRYHYADQPQPGWTPVNVKPIGGPALNAPAPSEPASEAQPTPTPSPMQNAADNAVRQKVRAEECARRREQLITYQNAPKIIERSPLGVERELSEDERLKLIEQTQQQVGDLCGPGAGRAGEGGE